MIRLDDQIEEIMKDGEGKVVSIRNSVQYFIDDDESSVLRLYVTRLPDEPSDEYYSLEVSFTGRINESKFNEIVEQVKSLL